jgi:hypothetical protein
MACSRAITGSQWRRSVKTTGKEGALVLTTSRRVRRRIPYPDRDPPVLTIRYYLPREQNAYEFRGRSESCLGRVNRVLLTTLVVVPVAIAADVIAVAVAVAAVVIS